MINLFKRKGHNPITKKIFWYAQWLKRARVDLYEIAENMCTYGCHSAGTTAAILLDFPNFLKHELLESNEVYLNGFGTFKLKANSPAKDTKEEVTTRDVTVEVVFEPTKEFIAQLKSASFKFDVNRRGKSKDDSENADK